MSTFPIIRAAYFSNAEDLRGLTAGKGDILVGTELGGLARVVAGTTGQTLMFNTTTDSGVEITGVPTFSGNVTAAGFNTGGLDIGTTAADTITGASGITISSPGNITITAAAPTLADHVATKGYFDSAIKAMDLKASVRLKTAAALPSYTADGNTLTGTASVGVLVIDETYVNNGDRILVDQVGTSEAGDPNAMCGIYDVIDNGVAGPFVMTRSSDADTSTRLNAGMFTFATEGGAFVGKGFVLIGGTEITINETPLYFVPIGGSNGVTVAGTSGSVQFNYNGNLASSDGLRYTSGTLAVETLKYATAQLQFAGSLGSDANALMVMGKLQTQTAVGNSVSLGYQALTGDAAVGLGANVTATGISSVSVGLSSTASGARAAAFGQAATATGDDSLAVGPAAGATGSLSVAIGPSTATAENAVSCGNLANASGVSSIAMGTLATAAGINGVALGEIASAAGIGSAGLGFHAVAAGDASLALGCRSLSNLPGCCNISAFPLLRKTGSDYSYCRSVAISMLTVDSFNLADTVPFGAGVIIIPEGGMFFPMGIRIWCSRFVSQDNRDPSVQIGVSTTYLGSNIASLTMPLPTALGASLLEAILSYQDGITGNIYVTNLAQMVFSDFHYRVGIYGHLVELD